MKIEIISASAGSGKTYTLAELLEKEVREERVRPDAILATTFTKKAAAELQERVRTKLLSEGLNAPAQQLAASRIGTVNSVCGQLLSDFSFELGISPVQKVLDEESTKAAIAQALSRVISSANQKEIISLQQIFEEVDVRNVVSKVISKARVNGLSPKALHDSAKLSITSFKKLLGKPDVNGDSLNTDLIREIDVFLNNIDIEHDATKITAKFLHTVKVIARRQRDNGYISWASWLKLSRPDIGKKSMVVAEPLNLAAAVQDRHPILHEDIIKLITLVFSLAADVLDAYQEYKKEWGVVDFVDQEVLTLKLLDMEVVQDQLRSELDLILVDEFQDTSPIQIAIFLKLAALAKNSVWVGDQKQAIYGFRDADPVLMDAAITEILKGNEPRTLDKSWRSRPELVRSTSDIFVQAFSGQGYPENRVRLEPAFNKEPEGLSPIYECWLLESTKQANDAKAVASAVKDFLTDCENNTIRDPSTKNKRQANGGDIAVLCRNNDICVDVAEALEQQGIKAALPRNGLLSCPEIILVLAALRLLIDPRDSLAKAEIARLIDNPEKHNAWLLKALSSPWAKGFDLEIFSNLDEIREAYQFSGPLELLDRAIEVTKVRSFCLQWGNSQSRLANLDALRIHCAKYIDECQAEGRGSSPAGLISYLENLENDTQAIVRDQDTVTVLTWHSCKGLEWPVTVLFQLEKVYKGKALGVTVVSEKQFDLYNPLAERWIRYWPYPYGKLGKGAPFHDRLAMNQATIEAEEREERQELRLLYVGWTRARDKVVFAGRNGFLKKGILRLLVDENESHLLEMPEESKAVWADREVDIKLKSASPQDPITLNDIPGTGYVATGMKDFPAAAIPASKVQLDCVGSEPEKIGDVLSVTGKPDAQHLGEAIHTFLAADYDLKMDQKNRLLIAKNILNRWAVAANFTPESMVAVSDRLYSWINGKWPEAVWHREWPIELKTSDGTIIRGFIDLALELSDGFVVIDHKSFHGSFDEVADKAASFGGQLWSYGEAIKRATGKIIKSHLIHFPVMGIMVEVNEK
jgi:ATP-dependent helicase/nuclease subunit A